jgi:PleD family two-component response regulator
MPTTPKRRQAEPYVPSILVVDDDPLIRTSFRKILEEAGYLVTAASSGREASKGRYRLVLRGHDLGPEYAA